MTNYYAMGVLCRTDIICIQSFLCDLRSLLYLLTGGLDCPFPCSLPRAHHARGVWLTAFIQARTRGEAIPTAVVTTATHASILQPAAATVETRIRPRRRSLLNEFAGEKRTQSPLGSGSSGRAFHVDDGTDTDDVPSARYGGVGGGCDRDSDLQVVRREQARLRRAPTAFGIGRGHLTAISAAATSNAARQRKRRTAGFVALACLVVVLAIAHHVVTGEYKY